MFTKLRAFWYIATHAGSARQVMNEVNSWGRFCVLEALREIGLFDYLREPRTLQEILQQFDFANTNYTLDVLVALINDAEGFLILEDGKYRMTPGKALPVRADMESKLSPKILQLHASRDLARQIPVRMRNQESEFARRLESERSDLLNFDSMLGSKIYDAARVTAHMWAMPLIGSLEGKKLLDVGCGAGRETAHLWLLMEGKVKIAAIDPVPSFSDMARDRFAELIKEPALNKGKLPTVTEANTPEFHTMAAGDLDFPDEHFDIVFHSAMLHWTPEPKKAIGEMLRVLKPGGVIFGGFTYKPVGNNYQDLILRTSGNVGGFPWQDDLFQWHIDGGAKVEELAGGIFRAKKAERPSGN